MFLFNPIVGINLNIPIFRWGARFKTNRQQKAYISIQKLQQSYVTDNINEELSAALTKLAETEYQVKTAKETMSLANENLDLVSFSRIMRERQTWWMYSPHNCHGRRRTPI